MTEEGSRSRSSGPASPGSKFRARGVALHLTVVLPDVDVSPESESTSSPTLTSSSLPEIEGCIRAEMRVAGRTSGEGGRLGSNGWMAPSIDKFRCSRLSGVGDTIECVGCASPETLPSGLRRVCRDDLPRLAIDSSRCSAFPFLRGSVTRSRDRDSLDVRGTGVGERRCECEERERRRPAENEVWRRVCPGAALGVKRCSENERPMCDFRRVTPRKESRLLGCEVLASSRLRRLWVPAPCST